MAIHPPDRRRDGVAQADVAQSDAAARDERRGPSPPPAKGDRLLAFLRAQARAQGFDALGVAPAAAPGPAGDRLADWLAQGRHGAMAWMADRAQWRADPRALWPQARAIVMLGMNYGPHEDPLAVLARRGAGAISVYARHRDYHDVLKGRLKTIAGALIARAGDGADAKVFVDTAPVMEKPLAAAAGLGWQGKHTNLVSREFGSWLFLGAIFTTVELPATAPEIDHCGSCRACLDVCPTQAFPAPYQLDARRCVSYLTIEHPGPIPRDLRAAIGNRVYGCDDCLAVCPWNKFAQSARETKLVARADLAAPDLAFLVRLDDAGFRAFFAGGPIKRVGHARFLRNVLIACGNSGDPALIASVRARLDDPAALARGAAVWALARLSPQEAAERAATRAPDPDPDVEAEWRVVTSQAS
jgi:epoxyqueuosine reductase